MQWKHVPGFEMLYEVSDCGDVRRIAPWSDGRRQNNHKRILLWHIHPKLKSCRVTLFRNGERFPRQVHALVMLAFVGPLAPGKEINHKDGSRLNNKLENLEYCTHSENMYHRYRVLGQKGRPGEKHHKAKVTEDQVRTMREMYAIGMRMSNIGRLFGVSQYCAEAIVKRINWKHVL